jgi:pimeloyl-ACP methyl ester carboxylesterase
MQEGRMLTDSLTRVDGLELAYRAHGVGPTLLLLHAFPLNQRMWDPQLEALADRCHVVTVDLPGFGASQTTDGDFTIDQLADLVADFATRLGHERIVLGGLSMGGYIALAFARRHPERLRGLILADTRAGADAPEAREKRLALIEEVGRAGTKGLAGSFPHTATAPATAIDRPELLKQLEGWIRQASPDAVRGALRMMADRPDATPVLATIRVPTLVIVGEADGATPPPEAEKLATGVAGAELVRIPAAGHLSSLEAPEAFNRAVLAFMARFH